MKHTTIFCVACFFVHCRSKVLLNACQSTSRWRRIGAGSGACLNSSSTRYTTFSPARPVRVATRYGLRKITIVSLTWIQNISCGFSSAQNSEYNFWTQDYHYISARLKLLKIIIKKDTHGILPCYILVLPLLVPGFAQRNLVHLQMEEDWCRFSYVSELLLHTLHCILPS